jgi:hypothetical protein
MKIYTSTVINYDYYFYLDSSKMKEGDRLLIQILNNVKSSSTLFKKALDSNDYNYVYNNIRSSGFTSGCSEAIFSNGDIYSSFYDCGEFTNSKAVLLRFTLNKGSRFSNYKINLISRKNVTDSNDIFENYKKEELGFYLLNMEELNKYNKNILIYSSENKAMNIYVSNYLFDKNYDYYNYKSYKDMKLFFIDPSNPESEKTTSSNPTKYYTIFIYNPLLEEYSLYIKFINKNIEFIKESTIKLQESIIRKSYYVNETSSLDIYQTLKYEEKNGENVENYSITFHELYGDFDAEMIVLDNINAKTKVFKTLLWFLFIIVFSCAIYFFLRMI